MKVLIVDFYDSFTYNLKHYIDPMCSHVEVIRDDEIVLDKCSYFDKIILSPGPGLPKNTINMNHILNMFSGKKPILGVCLGMQGIAEFYDAELKQHYVNHGKKDKLKVDVNSVLFKNIDHSIDVGLYHSWHVNRINQEVFTVTSRNQNGVIMSFESIKLGLFGLQFHPESIMTISGREIINNFINFDL